MHIFNNDSPLTESGRAERSGKFAERCQAGLSHHIWTETFLGDCRQWPQPLCFAVQMLIDSALPMWLVWGEDRATIYNAACRSLFFNGHPHALGAPMRDVAGDNAPEILHLAAEALSGKSASQKEGQLVLHGFEDQKAVRYAVSGLPLRDESGIVRGAIFTAWKTVDGEAHSPGASAPEDGVLPQQDTHEADAIERYRLARLTTNDAIWDWRLSDGQVIWNQALGALFGYHFEQTSADWWIAHIHPEDRSFIDKSIHEVIDGEGVNWSAEYRFQRADGSYAEIFDRGAVLRAPDGSPVRMIGAMLDLSERKAAERALRESERLFRTLFECIDEGFCVIEFIDGPHGPLSDYVHVMANSAYARNTGIENVVGQRVRDMVPQEAQGWVDIYRRVLLTGEPVRFQRELEHTGRYLELAALRIEPLERRQVAVLFQDVTGRYRAENALRELNDTLERRVLDEVARSSRIENALHQAQKMEAVGQLTGGIAHDFNNMLAIISNALDLIGRRSAATDDYFLNYLKLAKSGVTRASQLTHRLLAFSRQQPLHPRPVLVNELVAGMSELLKHSLGGSIVFDTVLAAEVTFTYIDPNQFENIIVNLVVNARDAMQRGGRLTIETKNCLLQAHDVADQDGLAPGAYVIVAVRDTGIGMSKDVLSRAFEPFFTTKGPGHGTGLGLSQVYGFVRQSGGQVRIESEEGKGTVVSLYLPQYAGKIDEDVKPRTVTAIRHGNSSETILLTDDEETVRTLIGEMLTHLGYRVISAEGSTSALAALERHPEIQLLITDVLMPEMNGRELADEALKMRPALKVMFITGYASNVLLANEDPGKDVRIISKPFTMDDLALRVREILDHG
jgi:PAS domain S-box-containing protein